MPRGGVRPGAGRPRKVQPPAVSGIRDFDLISRLRRMPASPVGRQRRVVLVMAAFDAPADVIAAALAIPEPELREFYAAELAMGAAMKLGNLIAAHWSLARAGNARAVIELTRRIERSAQT